MMKIKKVKLTDIRPNSDNPRTIKRADLDKLVKSIQEFPEMMELREIIVDEDMVILGGNMRYRALNEIGETECIAKIVTGLTPEQKREFIIKDNAFFGEWDMDLLSAWESFPDVDLANWGVDLPEDWMQGDKEGLTDDDAVPEVVEPVVKSGDLWLLGLHSLLCGDSTKKEDVERLLDGNKVDLVFTDPPFDFEDTAWFRNAFNFLQGHFFIYGSEKVIIPFLTDENFCRLFAVDFRNANLISNKVPFTRIDFIAEFKSTKSKFINTKDGFSTLIEMPKVKSHQKQNIGHPHQKKVELIELFLNHYTIKNENVLDAFLGSGTTLMACEKLNRACRGIEKEPKYCDIIISRWENYTGKKAILKKE